jgi:muconolactone delta-isomerase
MDPAANDSQSQQMKYQVTIHFEMDENFMSLVPPHRTYINYLINKNIIDSYTVSLESMRSWVVMNGASKEEIMSLLEKSPLFKYWTIEIDELYVVDGQPYRLPALQPN